MDLVRFGDAPFDTAPDHDDVVARRRQGGEASAADFALIGNSAFPAGAVVPMGAGSFGKMYVATEGAVTIELADGARHVLRPGDGVIIPAGEGRAVRNDGDGPAAMIVVTPPA